jgi:hypothetical protein
VPPGPGLDFRLPLTLTLEGGFGDAAREDGFDPGGKKKAPLGEWIAEDGKLAVDCEAMKCILVSAFPSSSLKSKIGAIRFSTLYRLAS